MMRPRRSGRQNSIDQAIGWLRLGGNFHVRGLARGRWDLEGDYQQFPLWLGGCLRHSSRQWRFRYVWLFAPGEGGNFGTSLAARQTTSSNKTSTRDQVIDGFGKRTP